MTPPRRAALLLFLTFAAFYAATTRGVFVFGDDVLAFQVTESLLDDGDFTVTSPADAGGVARPAIGRAGERYSKYGLGLSLVAVPFDLGGRLAERLGVDLPATRSADGNLRTGTRVFAAGLTNSVIGALAVVALLALALEAGFSLGIAAALAATLGGATFFAHYAATFLSEPLAAACLAGAAAFAMKSERLFSEGKDGAATRAVAWSGALAGFAVLTKVFHLAAVIPLGVWLGVRFLRRPAAARGGAGAGVGGGSRAGGAAPVGVRLSFLWMALLGVGVMAVASYNFLRFGSVFETGYGAEATRFTTPLLTGLGGLLLSPGRSVLWYAPPLLLAIVGSLRFARRRPDATALVAAMTVPALAATALYYQWWGGGAWGPRLLVPLLPLWLLPAGEALAAWPRFRSVRIFTVAVLAAGVAVVALAVLVPFDRYQELRIPDPSAPSAGALQTMIWDGPETPLAVHAARAPAALAETTRLLLGRAPLPGPDEKSRPGLPDLAFAHYGSHALLQWSRAGLFLALVGAFVVWRRSRRAPRSGWDSSDRI